MFVGYNDNTWSNTVIDVPDDTPEDKIDDVACDALLAELEKEKKEVAFVGVLHRPQLDDDDDTEP